MFFREKTDQDTHDWIVASFEWAVAEGLLTKETPLVTPTSEHFRTPSGKDHETVMGLVDDLKRILKIEGHAIDVMALDVLPDEYRHEYGVTSSVAGTWQGDEEHSLVRYDPNLMNQPLTLLSTLAHELMHHLLHHRAYDMPGGPEAEELNTDLHVITMGLGLIQMLGAEAAGWSGYMRQSTRAYALAVFLEAKGLPAQAATNALPSRAAKYVRNARKDLDPRVGELNRLKSALGR